MYVPVVILHQHRKVCNTENIIIYLWFNIFLHKYFIDEQTDFFHCYFSCVCIHNIVVILLSRIFHSIYFRKCSMKNSYKKTRNVRWSKWKSSIFPYNSMQIRFNIQEFLLQTKFNKDLFFLLFRWNFKIYKV